MEVVTKAFVHKANGSTFITEYPELKGMTFQNQQEKERYRKRKLKEMFGDKIEDIPADTRMDLILHTAILPEGVTSLPPNWTPMPVETPKVVQKPLNQATDEIVTPFKFKTPRFKNERESIQ